ncbi:hypothetical protein D623_10033002 [Myotis brandtii]|uniref:Uncharacterized protein n=1 Tax=Myotis brandtii TaxID=109478 RepID=S7N9Y1_MYOBR|nr:hypothetical protein D623_10033002 [Myotis brandtii]
MRSCPLPEPPEQSAGLLFTLRAQEAPGDQERCSKVGRAASEQHDTHSFIIQPFTEPAVSMPHGGCMSLPKVIPVCSVAAQNPEIRKFTTYSSFSSFGCKVNEKVKYVFFLPYQCCLKSREEIEING